MIYIKQENNVEVYKIDIPKEISINDKTYQLLLLNGMSKEILHITDLNNYSASDYFVSLRIDPEPINKLNKGYYNYVLKGNDNNIVACGLLAVEAEKTANTVYDRNTTNIVYQG